MMKKLFVNLLTCYVCFSECVQLILGTLNQRKEFYSMQILFNEYILIASVCSFFIIFIFTIMYNSNKLYLKSKFFCIIVITIAIISMSFQIVRLLLYDTLYIPAYILLFYSFYTAHKQWIINNNEKSEEKE